MNRQAHARARALRLVSASLQAPDATRRDRLPWAPVCVLIALWAIGMRSEDADASLLSLLPVIALVMVLVRLVRVRRLRPPPKELSRFSSR